MDPRGGGGRCWFDCLLRGMSAHERCLIDTELAAINLERTAGLGALIALACDDATEDESERR